MTALVAASGCRIGLAIDRWYGEVDDVERSLLASLDDPVLDIGCGPGRVAAALAAAGRPALGIDTSPVAVATTAARGAAALRRSVFDAVPGTGRWGGAVLLDGNIGIGGDPDALLRRLASLLRPGGRAIVELEPPGTPTERLAVRLEDRRGSRGPWFPWARVAVDAISNLAARAGLACLAEDERGGRWFAALARP